MNTINNTGKWSDISATLNANFNLIAAKLSQLDNVAWKCLGIYNSLTELKGAHSNAPIGSYAYIGTSPYTLYVFGNSGWYLSDSGLATSQILQKEFDFSDVPDASETERGFMSTAHVTQLNGATESIATINESIGSLNTNVGTLNTKVSSNTTKINELDTQIKGLQNNGVSKLDIEKIYTAIENEATERAYVDEFLQSEIIKATYNMLSSTPFFGWFVSGNVGVELAGLSSNYNYTVVFLESTGTFAAFYNNKYYNTWGANGEYASAASYGEESIRGHKPSVGKIYIKGKTLYVWDGSKMSELVNLKPLLEFEAQVVQSDKGVFFTEENGIEARLGKGLMLDDNNAIAINDNEVVTPEDHAPKLTVGFADNLVGRGEATDETITFRQSAGNVSVEDGTARVTKIKGNTVVWNQLAKNSNVSLHSNANYRAFGATEMSIADANHQYLIIYKVVGADASGNNIDTQCCIHLGNTSSSRDKNLAFPNTNTIGYFFVKDGLNYPYIGANVSQKENDVITDDKSWSLFIQVHDLTTMFGAGNEPTTYSGFLAKTLPYNTTTAHNAGQLISLTAKGIKTVGLNAWDEQWDKHLTNENIYSKNRIPIIGGQTYFFTTTNEEVETFYMDVYQYDRNGVALGKRAGGVYLKRKDGALLNNPCTFAPEVASISVFFSPSYGREYKNDVCIHLAHTGLKNGTYEPYTEEVRELPIAKYFPEGMKRARNAYDELTATKAIKRIGSVDLGTLKWVNMGGTKPDAESAADASMPRFAAILNPMKVTDSYNTIGNIVCAQYNSVTLTDTAIRKVGVAADSYDTSRRVYIYDPQYTTEAELKAALSGVILYYEMAEPVVTNIDKPLNMVYKVWDYGTESVVSDGATAPLRADIIYQFNAVDRIRENTLKIIGVEETIGNINTILEQL